MQFPRIVGNRLMFVIYLLLFEKNYSLIGPPVEQALDFHRGGRGSSPILGRNYKLRLICQDCRTKCSIFLGSRDSVVGTATRLQPGLSGLRIWQR